jgi:hypothetical protein
MQNDGHSKINKNNNNSEFSIQHSALNKDNNSALNNPERTNDNSNIKSNNPDRHSAFSIPHSALNNPQPPITNLTAPQLWGRILTFFRKNCPPAFFQTISRQDPQKVKLENGTLTIYASREDYLNLCGDQLQEDLRRALLNENLNYRIIIEKDSTDIDIEKEIIGMRSEFGESKVKIVK